jgi:O-antigen/teichoic acid export membrane protein
MIVATVAAAVVWVVAPALAHVFLHGVGAGPAASDIRLVTPFIPLGALSACVLAGARGFGRMWPYLAVEGLGKPTLRLGLVLVALIGGWGVYGALVAWSLPVAVGLGAACLVLARLISSEAPRAELQPSPDPHGYRAAEFWRFAAPRGFAGVFQVVVVWLDVLLVGAILSTYQAGVYAAVSKLAMVGTFALGGVQLAIAPHLSALLAREEARGAADLYQSATRWLMLASWPVYVLFAIFPTVVLGIFGSRYSAGATALVILSLAMLVNLGTGNVTVVLLMGGKSSWNVVNTLAALVVNVALNLLLLPHIGIAGAAIAWAASIVVDNVAAVVEVWLVLGLSPFGPGYGLVVAASAGCFGLTGLLARVLLGANLPALVAAAVVGLLAYSVINYLARARLQLDGFVLALRAGRTRRAAGQPAQQVA